MKPKQVQLIFLIVVLLLSVIPAVPGAAEEKYPARSIEFIVNFPPGGPLDTATRIFQTPLQTVLGVPIIITTKGGAAGAMGADFAAKAKADGYTVLSSNNGALTIAPNVNPQITYRVKDFTPICSFAADPGVIASKADAPWKNLEGLIEYAKKNPGKLNYGSPGVGAVPFFAMEVFKQAHGIDIVPVQFQGTGPVKNAILGGHVHLAACGISALAPLFKAGSLIPLVTTASKRLPDFPNVPTLAELGFPEASLNLWLGLFVPKMCPRNVVEKLSWGMDKVMRDPAVISQMEKAGLLVDYRSGEATLKDLEQEFNAVAKVVQKTGAGK